MHREVLLQVERTGFVSLLYAHCRYFHESSLHKYGDMHFWGKDDRQPSLLTELSQQGRGDAIRMHQLVISRHVHALG